MRRWPGAVMVLVLVGACAAEKEPKSEPGIPDTTVVAASTVPPGPESTTTTTPVADLGAVALQLQEVAAVDQPTAFAARAGDPAVYIGERGGRVRRIAVQVTSRRSRNSTTPVTTQTFRLDRSPVLDIADGVLADGQEQGLLGLTFSTDGNRLYVAYTGTDGRQHLDEYGMGADRPDTGSRRELLVIDDFADNHNGGGLAFGPDGFLYWSMGDGGGAGDPRETGQDPGDLLGSILRIDPDVAPETGTPYAVPEGNPFAAGGGAPEVWAYGLRNPWRFSFDRVTGDLWIADVGQGEVEEINLLTAEGLTGAGRGVNLGWSELEGDEPFEGGERPDDAVDPILTYGHDGGRCSVTGGFAYRGTAVPALLGAYLYGDFCEGEVRAVVQRDGEVVDDRELGLRVSQLSSFGEGADGELWALSLDGPVYRIVPPGS